MPTRAGRIVLTCLALLSLLALVAGTARAQATVSHVVQPGESLASIARSYGISVDAIMAANGLSNANLIHSGQSLEIPVSATLTPTPAPTAVRYTVRVGESLARIALALGVSLPDLMLANGLTDPDLIRVGQVLEIPPGVRVATVAAVTPSPSPTLTPTPTQPAAYTVKPGDTLASIAAALDTTTAALIQANRLASPDMLYTGQQLLIPSRHAPATATPSPAGSLVPAPTPTIGPGFTAYPVKFGDTLVKIAAAIGTSPAAIAHANGLVNPDSIVPGMVLRIPIRVTQAPNWPGGATRFVASITEQRCWLYQAQAVIGDWPCSTGRKGWESQPGTYRIQSKMERAYGSAWDIWMPYWLGLYQAGSTENGIHGMPWNADTKAPTWEGLVGTPITYGCVMINDEHARLLYDMAYIGMPVTILP